MYKILKDKCHGKNRCHVNLDPIEFKGKDTEFCNDNAYFFI